MKIVNLLWLALRAIKRNKMRSFLTMLGIIIGVAAVIAMIAIGQGSKQSIQNQISAMGSNMITIRPSGSIMGGARMDIGSVQTLTERDVTALQKQAKYINAVSPSVSARGQVVNGATGNTIAALAHIDNTIFSYTFVSCLFFYRGIFWILSCTEGIEA